jgi:hypothetical protein
VDAGGASQPDPSIQDQASQQAAAASQKNGLYAALTMQRKLRTKPGRAIYAQRGASVEPVFGQMKDRQGAGQFSTRGLAACQGEWQLHAAVHNLRKLHRESVRRGAAGSQMAGKRADGA